MKFYFIFLLQSLLLCLLKRTPLGTRVNAKKEHLLGRGMLLYHSSFTVGDVTVLPFDVSRYVSWHCCTAEQGTEPLECAPVFHYLSCQPCKARGNPCARSCTSQVCSEGPQHCDGGLGVCEGCAAVWGGRTDQRPTPVEHHPPGRLHPHPAGQT